MSKPMNMYQYMYNQCVCVYVKIDNDDTCLLHVCIHLLVIVWNCVALYGRVHYGMVWRGRVRHVMALWYGMVWKGMERYGTVYIHAYV